MKLKRAMGIILAGVLMLSMAACGKDEGSKGCEGDSSKPADASAPGQESSAVESKQGDMPDYLNLDSELPIVKEGMAQTLVISVFQNAGWGDADKVWFWEYVRQEMNITPDITEVIDQAEYKSMTFASDSLPDVMIAMSLSPVELVKYGMGEQQLLEISQYINETLMPNLYAVYQKYPEFLDMITAPDGKLYALGNIGPDESIEGCDEIDVGGIPRLFINQDWLKQAGVETPETLNDFLDLLRKFKTFGDDVIPLGGGNDAINPSVYILNALGYLGWDAYGIAMRNDKPVIPYGDREAFGEFLKIMNTMYTEGLISQDYFSIDANTVRAQMAEGQIGVLAEPAYLSLPAEADYVKWWAVKPLTSDFNDTQQWIAANNISTGNFAVSSKTKVPELALRFADWFFDMTSYNTRLAWQGPGEGTDITYDMVKGATYNGIENIFPEVESGECASVWDYVTTRIAGFSGDLIGFSALRLKADSRIGGHEELYKGQDLNEETVTNGDLHYRWSVKENLYPYTKKGYPPIQFFTEEESIEMSDLSTVLQDTAKQEIAKFINGDRPLTEIDDYFETLDGLGFQDYLQYYVDYYEVYMNK